MTAISLTINGRQVAAEVEARMHLADFLRERLRLTGTHLGCEHGVCGACTVLIDDAPVRSCIAYAVACDGLQVRTIEGFEDDLIMGELRKAFSREHGLQCGFCTAGMLIMSRDIVRRLPYADEQRIRTELSGNLCRCTGYLGIVKAVASVVALRRLHDAPTAELPVAAPAISVEPARFAVAESVLSVAADHGVAMLADTARQGWTRIDESFVIAATPAVAWQALADFPGVARCLPGAELTEHDAQTVKGRLKVRLGPMAASFAGSATVQRDDAALRATIKGAGSDGLSRSRTRGELSYRLTPESDGRLTRVAVTVEYDLQGPLAQFSRSNVARDFARRIIAEFASNLNARLAAPDSASAPRVRAETLNALGILWQVARDRIAALFRRSR